MDSICVSTSFMYFLLPTYMHFSCIACNRFQDNNPVVPLAFYRIYTLDFVYNLLCSFPNCHEIVHMYADIIIGVAVVIGTDSSLGVASCWLEIKTAEGVG